MSVRFTETALAETRDILAYIAEDNATAAERVAAAIERTLAWIGRWPETPPIVFGDDVRAKLVSGYQIRIFYSVGDKEIIIRNVRSTKRLRPWESAS